jgi:hypothetical protein
MALPSDTDMELYCSNKRALLRTICRSNQWSGINEGNIDDWLHHNFKETKGKYFAIKILLHGLYYSESNLIELLKDGIYNKILGNNIKRKLISDKNIYKLKSEIEAEIRAELTKTLFIPLLDNDKPSESGNAIVRYLVHKLGILNGNTSFHFLVNLDELAKYSKIIIVDDCLGSGDQLNSFWNYNAKFDIVKKKAQSLGIEIYYLILIGNEEALMELQLNGDLVGLKVIICEKVNKENRVFHLNNNIWNGDNDELEDAISYLDQINNVYGIPRLGFNEMDYAVFIHNTTPDWSLPIFWAENSDWKPLFKRKNSEAI